MQKLEVESMKSKQRIAEFLKGHRNFLVKITSIDSVIIWTILLAFILLVFWK